MRRLFTASAKSGNGDDATFAFAQAPAKYTARKTSVDPNSPAETGGGSEGYNWNLAHSNDY